jgi:hypothetical protein
MVKTYSFNTKFTREILRPRFPDIFILSKLKQDLEVFLKQLEVEKPEFVVGFAELKRGKFSKFESIAVNDYNRNSKVIKGGLDSFKLFIPKDKPNDFRVCKTTTTSFCNYTMYKIAHFINEKQLPTKLVFIHLNEKDIRHFHDLALTLS